MKEQLLFEEMLITKHFCSVFNEGSQMPRHLIGDAHEWINEISTVPTHSPAKLQPSQRSWDYLCVTHVYVTHTKTTIICYTQQRGKKTLLSLTLICYCHLVGMAKIVRGSMNNTTMKHRYLSIWLTYCIRIVFFIRKKL